MATVIGENIKGEKIKMDTSKMTWRPSIYGIVIENGKILMANQFGGYDLPGGGIDIGETLDEALKREFKEETGIDIEPIKFIDCRSNFFEHPVKNDHVQSIMIYMLCKKVGGELTDNLMTEAEKQHGGQMPEWIDVTKLSEIPIASSIDFAKILSKHNLI